MEWLLLYVPALACAAMMLVVCIPMMHKISRDHDEHGAASSEEIAELREEVARLRVQRAPESKPKETADG
ncbi:MAG: hypothetical protein M3285_04465 [Actinomycetota bacterium]|nr:hypothetical protein [Actinomycetota bacterium]